MDPIKFNDTPDYQHITVQGKEGVFTPANIAPESLPDGFYKYNLIAGDESMFGGVTAGETEDFAGSFITKNPLPSMTSDLEDADWSFADKDFEFESFFGKKLSIDAQIQQAQNQRDMMQEGNHHDRSQNRDEFEREL